MRSRDHAAPNGPQQVALRAGTLPFALGLVAIAIWAGGDGTGCRNGSLAEAAMQTIAGLRLAVAIAGLLAAVFFTVKGKGAWVWGVSMVFVPLSLVVQTLLFGLACAA